MKVLIPMFLLISMLLMVGCSGGEADYTLEEVNPDLSGKFIDDAVEGLEYSRSNGDNGLTLSGGNFIYKRGEKVSFHIGALGLGESLGGSIMTPRELAGATHMIEEPVINNRVRLMLALDRDLERIGIQIDEPLRRQAEGWNESIDFNQSESDFTAAVSLVTNGEITDLPTADEANAHFAKTLRCAYSGAYQGAWDVPDSNETDGYVGVMLQANGTVIVMGDGQTVNDQEESVIYVVGNHDINTRSYLFDPDVFYYYDRTEGTLAAVTEGVSISGTGVSEAYDHIVGSFVNGTQSGRYEVRRADASSDAAYRFTGFGWDMTPGSYPIGMIIMDVDPDGKVSGLIHYIPDISIQPQLHGTVDFISGDVNITVDAPEQSILPVLSSVRGTINFNDTSAASTLVWTTTEGEELGSVQLDGCQLQAID